MRATPPPTTIRLLATAFAIAGCVSSDDVGTTDDAGGDAGGGADGGTGGTGDPSDPALTGPFSVHIADGVTIPTSGGSVTATLCSPSSDGGASRGAGPYPLVVSSPGFQIPRSQYQSMCEHLASWGYLVILQSYSQTGFSISHQVLAEDVGEILDWATGATSPLSGRVDLDRIAAVGHSLGGKISIFAAILDSRIGAVVGWDPVDANSPSLTPDEMHRLTVPLAVLGETLDATGDFMACAPEVDNYQRYFDHACAAPAALEVTVLDADHMHWVDDRQACGLVCAFCRTGSANPADTQALTRRVTTAFFERHLRGIEAAERWLALPDMGTGVEIRDQVPPGNCS